MLRRWTKAAAGAQTLDASDAWSERVYGLVVVAIG
jgi:hypothetical protein